jgi:MPBQ/MSBQ methyltransferase
MMAQGFWPGALRLLPNTDYTAGYQPFAGRSLAELINQRYDTTMYSDLVDEYYDHSGFHNYGYWTPRTLNQRQASENLVDVLVGFFTNKKGMVLDVACGKGASTKRLMRDYDPRHVTGINISEKQLATCRQRAPGCRFLNMDATKLRFPDDTFDNILCVEAAFHFDTREKFLREAYRVLKPGGCLALSDILVRSKQVASLMKRIPLANFVADTAEYRSIVESVGFRDVRLVEARKQCWEGFRDHALKFAREKVFTGQASLPALRSVAVSLARSDWTFSNYLLVSACKPHPALSRGGRR